MATIRRKAKKPAGTQPPVVEEPPSSHTHASFPIVGIGASAGGLAAFEAFFSGMPTDTDPGMAFVLVQHLAPDHKSILTDLIRRYTRMQVFEVQDGMTVRPNCAYIIPPNRDMAFLNGALQLIEPSAPRGQRLPIDFFFRSLAQNERERAIGIVLSGTGSDGTLGVRAIKDEGGMVMAQTPASTEYDGMPRNAIATGLVDYELPPAEMPARLITYVAHALIRPTGPVAAVMPKTENALKKIFILLRAQTGHDFSRYKPSTFNRRVERRMAVHQIASIDAYVKYLQQTPVEVDALFRDLLISVTSFFRDPEAFRALEEQIIPKVFAGIPVGGMVRAWSAGCSTGEEAYSLAIQLAERQEEMKQSFKLQVFATDIDGQAIAKARAGLYPASVASDISPERLARFFTAESDGSGYRIHKSIRDVMIFSEQDLIRDPPFSKLDLISCRNVLIYMSGDLQKKIIPLLHYALNPGGFLFLGTSESVGEFGDLFAPLDRKLKLYQRREDSHRGRRIALGQFIPSMAAIEALTPQPTGMVGGAGKRSLRELTEQALLEQVAPCAALVSGNGDILYVHGRTGQYLEPAAGEARINNILKMAREGLRRDLTIALRKAAGTKEIVRCPRLRVRSNGDFNIVDLTIRPVAKSIAAMPEAPLYLVIFQDAPPLGPEPAKQAALRTLAEGGGSKTDVHARIVALKQELRTKEESLQSANEELETSNEELQSSNEEMQSVNEELQSTNEELETSKEELQSVNEELATVNSELQTKVADLSRANNDMNNLLAGTGIGTVFVDHKLRILRFTPATTRLINLIAGDVGRPVNHILSNLVGYDSLLADVQAVLDYLVPKEVEVQTLAGEWYSMRILPYRTLDNVIEGAVITFVDISRAKKAQEALREIEEKNRLILESITDAFFSIDADMIVRYFNPAAEQMLKRKASEVIGLRLFDVFPETQGSIFENNIAQSIRTKEAISFEVEFAMPPYENFYEVRVYPLANGITVFFQVITARKQAEGALRESELQFRQLAELLPQPGWICMPDGRCDYVNRPWVEFTGVADTQQVDFGWLDQVHPDDRSGLMAAWKKSAAAQEPFQTKFRVRHHNGDYHWFDMRATPLRDEVGRIVKWFAMNINITDQKPRDQTESGPERAEPVHKGAAP
jgi:two-component system, chemotaxis family, CheB/CheR fusion protein